ncbi:MAG: hypothetical protein KBC69_04455 [Candidatus Magasanikbacteria bacterium]|nr:hypothetical protein [Candidatus Magasanikbacteria bacterium]
MLANKTKPQNLYKGRYGLWRMVYLLIFLVLLSAVGLTYYFIYQNIYSTIANTTVITALKSSVNIYNLDIPAFHKASEAIEKKQKLEYFAPDIRNIFFYKTNTTTPVVTSTYAASSTKR